MWHFSSERAELDGGPASAPELLYWLVRERCQFEQVMRSISIDDAAEPGWTWPVRDLPMDDMIVLDFDGGDDDPIRL